MRWTGLNGSIHQEGTTSRLFHAAGEVLRGAGDEATLLDLASLEVEDCRGCYRCKTEPRCPQYDDMNDIAEGIARSDALVLSTPIYLSQCTALLKRPMERLIRFRKKDGSAAFKKPAFLIVTQGNGEDDGQVSAYLEIFTASAARVGISVTHVFRVGSCFPGNSIDTRPEILSRCREEMMSFRNGLLAHRATTTRAG